MDREVPDRCPTTSVVEHQVGLRGAGDVAGEATALTAAERYLSAWTDIWLIGRAFDWPRARRATERRTGAVVRDQVQCLGWVVLCWPRLTHIASINSYVAGENWRRSLVMNSNPLTC
jgi:hypothetical protein